MFVAGIGGRLHAGWEGGRSWASHTGRLDSFHSRCGSAGGLPPSHWSGLGGIHAECAAGAHEDAVERGMRTRGGGDTQRTALFVANPSFSSSPAPPCASHSPFLRITHLHAPARLQRTRPWLQLNLEQVKATHTQRPPPPLHPRPAPSPRSLYPPSTSKLCTPTPVSIPPPSLFAKATSSRSSPRSLAGGGTV